MIYYHRKTRGEFGRQDISVESDSRGEPNLLHICIAENHNRPADITLDREDVPDLIAALQQFMEDTK